MDAFTWKWDRDKGQPVFSGTNIHGHFVSVASSSDHFLNTVI